MFIIAAAFAAGRKVSDERAARKVRRQGLLEVHDSDVAKRAFASPTVQTLQDAPSQTGIEHSGTEIKFEDPGSLDLISPTTTSPTASSTAPEYRLITATPTPAANYASPVVSHKGRCSVASPTETAITSNTAHLSPSTNSPPPYSLGPGSSARSPIIDSHDLDSRSMMSMDAVSFVTSSSGSQDGNSIRIKTNGSDLKSGFPYHPALFELRVHPSKWEAFTTQLVERTKFDVGDHAQMWAAAAATAMTGAVMTSILVGRGMNRKIQESKVKAGMQDMSNGGLGETLERWNREYFRERGLYAHLELSESAMKRPDRKSPLFRKESQWYSRREDRERKREERKFVIVVTKLEPGIASNSDTKSDAKDATELPGECPLMAELPTSGNVVEMSADEVVERVELEGDCRIPASVSSRSRSEKFAPPEGYAELEGDMMQLTNETHLGDKQEDSGRDSEEAPKPRPLMVTASAHEAFHKDTT